MDEQFAVVDWETYPIGQRPDHYPPAPVGVAIRWPSGKSEYLAFDHPAGDNNCTREEAERAVRYAFEKHTVICHNFKFDGEVAYKHFKLPFPKKWHCTLIGAYLYAPDADSLALKPLAEKYLGIKPDERDEVREWILANHHAATAKDWGAYIAYAPVALVGPYAIGDVERTWKLFQKIRQKVMVEMAVPYERERKLLPHLTHAELRGIRVDRDLLSRWVPQLMNSVEGADKLIRAALNAPELNVDSDDELAAMLHREGLVTHWETPAGVPFALEPQAGQEILTKAMNKDALRRCCTDTTLVSTLAYRNAAATMLRTFVVPWLNLSAEDGRLHTTWHQVRGQEKNGTRTGRIASATPNLSNVPNPNELIPPFGLPPLPSLRQALLPEEGCVWISADYSQQELRITAHYEADQMKHAYDVDPKMDLHEFARNLIKLRLNKLFPRKHVKNVAFASIYGAGIPKLARMMGVTEGEALEIRNAYFDALPGLENLIARVKEATRLSGYVRSLGGRILTVEPDKVIKGRKRTFGYKMPNKLIQGSAADQTKQAIVDFCDRGGSMYFLAQVYDEINISVPLEHVQSAAQLLKECMVNALPLTVPILVDMEIGPNWADLVPLEGI